MRNLSDQCIPVSTASTLKSLKLSGLFFQDLKTLCNVLPRTFEYFKGIILDHCKTLKVSFKQEDAL